MNDLAFIIIASLVGGLLSILLAAAISFRLSERINKQLVAFAAGTMLSAACLDILPEAVEALVHSSSGVHDHGAVEPLFMTLMFGILLFFALERAALWRHAHSDADHSAQSAATLVLIGDSFHNFVDGILIAAAFLTDTSLGIATTVAVIAHEVPQELGDFVVLLNGGWKKSHALLANAASGLASVVGGVVGCVFLQSAEAAIPYVLVIAAASFVYIAVADLLPNLHRQTDSKFATQAAWILCGASIVPLLGVLHHH